MLESEDMQTSESFESGGTETLDSSESGGMETLGSERTESRSDWQWLPELLLDSIIKKLISVTDYLRFSVVCKHWHSVATDHTMRKLHIESCSKQPPKLMIPTNNCSIERRGLYDICQGKILSLELPIVFNRRCCGSSYGWLAFAMDDLTIILFNPFIGRKLDLPSLEIEPHYRPEYFVKKVILSANPSLSPDNFEAVAIYGDMHRLAYIKVGQKTWTKIPNKFKPREFELVAADIIYHQSLIYAVNYWGQIVSTNSTTKQRIRVRSQTKRVCHLAYLVESSRAELFLVRRYLARRYPAHPEADLVAHEYVLSTSKFEVYKLARSGENKSVLKQVNDLEGDSFFLGDNHSVSVRASDFPGCQSNCLYFTDDYIEFYYPNGPRDMAIFNLKNESFEMHYVPNPILHKTMPPPIWITPTLNWN